MGEFDLIAQYFAHTPDHSDGAVALGVGDDCALLQPASGMQLAITSDMLVEGRHFLSTVSPEALGHKALAVNLSDLAACGAQPVAFTLALALPQADKTWLQGFSHGLLALAAQHRVTLIGGDTTAGPLNICITAMGHVPQGGALLRSGAQAGDDLYVSGRPGTARAALDVFRGTLTLPQPLFEAARKAMERPEPRVAMGLALRGIASAALDVSDGLLGDLSHLLRRSGCAAELDLNAVDTLLIAPNPVLHHLPLETARRFVLAGGDDYELVFSAPQARRGALAALANTLQLPLSRIGRISPSGRIVPAADNETGLAPASQHRIALLHHGAVVHADALAQFASFDHFSA